MCVFEASVASAATPNPVPLLESIISSWWSSNTGRRSAHKGPMSQNQNASTRRPTRLRSSHVKSLVAWFLVSDRRNTGLRPSFCFAAFLRVLPWKHQPRSVPPTREQLHRQSLLRESRFYVVDFESFPSEAQEKTESQEVPAGRCNSLHRVPPSAFCCVCSWHVCAWVPRFGFLDNFLMIVFGDFIDSTLCAPKLEKHVWVSTAQRRQTSARLSGGFELQHHGCAGGLHRQSPAESFKPAELDGASSSSDSEGRHREHFERRCRHLVGPVARGQSQVPGIRGQGQGCQGQLESEISFSPKQWRNTPFLNSR